MPLPTTTRGSNFGNYLPNAKALKALFEFPESADYALEKFRQKVKGIGGEVLQQAQSVLAMLEEFSVNVGLQRQIKGDPWAGSYQEATDFQNMQRNLGEEAARRIGDIKQFNMDYAIGDGAQLLRGYDLDSELTDSADKLFNSWLAENNLLSSNSVIYQCDSHGNVLRDKKGDALPADAAKVRQLIEDPQQGFQAFLQKKGLDSNLQQHAYPTQTAPQQTQQPAKTTAPQAQQPQQSDEGVRPTSGSGMG